MTSYTSLPLHNPSYRNSIPSSARGSWGDNGSSQGYMQLQDIMVTAQPDVDRNTPVNLQLEKAEGYISSSNRAIEFRRLDLAYKDYLRGYDVVVNYIPRHKDFGFYCDTRRGWESRYKSLLRSVREMEPKMEQVRLTVQEDNAKSVSQPNGESVSRQNQSYSSGFGIPSTLSSKPLSMPGLSRNIPEQLRPAVRPKPESMHGNAVGGSDLLQRFARLRIPSNDQGSAKSAPAMEESVVNSTSTSQTNGTSTIRLVG